MGKPGVLTLMNQGIISLNNGLILIAATVVLFAIFYALFVSPRDKAIRKIRESLDLIQNGDMLRKLPEDLKGDYKKAAESMNSILFGSKKLMGSILTSSEKTKNYVESLMVNANDTTRSAEEIAMSVSEIARELTP